MTRMHVLGLLGLGLVLGLSVCQYNPHLQKGKMACSDDGRCPSGYKCGNDNLCYLPRDLPTGTGTKVEVDASIVDAPLGTVGRTGSSTATRTGTSTRTGFTRTEVSTGTGAGSGTGANTGTGAVSGGETGTGTGTKGGIDAGPTCGGANQPCCAGNACTALYVCNSGTCELNRRDGGIATSTLSSRDGGASTGTGVVTGIGTGVITGPGSGTGTGTGTGPATGTGTGTGTTHDAGVDGPGTTATATRIITGFRTIKSTGFETMISTGKTTSLSTGIGVITNIAISTDIQPITP